VTDVNHFDAIATFYPRVLVPLPMYGVRALELMYALLTTGAILPPSQVVARPGPCVGCGLAGCRPCACE
jgi:hydroxybutyrate-dimer hydrolase